MSQELMRCVHYNDKRYELQFQDGTAVSKEVSLETNLKPQNEWPHKWEKPELLWKNTHDNADIEGQYYERVIVNLAVMAWEWKTKLKIREARKGETPNIRNTWANKETDDLFAKQNGVLYYAWFPVPNSSFSGLMVGNDDFIWGTAPGLKPLDTGGSAKIYDLQHTTAHELGHSLGLVHDDNFSDHIMWPYYNKQRLPQTNDIFRMQNFYGRKVLAPWTEAWIGARLARGVKPRVI